jgi:hypothetical protein
MRWGYERVAWTVAERGGLRSPSRGLLSGARTPVYPVDRGMNSLTLGISRKSRGVLFPRVMWCVIQGYLTN